MRTIVRAAERLLPPASLLAIVLVAAAACSAGGPSGSGPSASGGPSASEPPSTPTPVPSAIVPDSAEAAARLVAATSPLFASIERKNPDLIGQANWWDAVPREGAWQVTFRVGWGDCPAGCIDEHVWIYDVTKDGTVTRISETGTELPPDVLASLAKAATQTGAAGRVTAGPTCPVENPNDPTSCQPRPVAGAVLIVRGAGGVEVARVTTDATGLFEIGLQPGDYSLEPQPVEGLMGTPAQMPFTVADRGETWLDVGYDTGIR